jgi:hypothetical protein
VPDKTKRTEALDTRKPEEKRHHLDADEKQKQHLADGRCARDDSFRSGSNPPEGQG